MVADYFHQLIQGIIIDYNTGESEQHSISLYINKIKSIAE